MTRLEHIESWGACLWSLDAKARTTFRAFLLENEDLFCRGLRVSNTRLGLVLVLFLERGEGTENTFCLNLPIPR